MLAITNHQGININDGDFASLSNDVAKFGVVSYSVSSLQELRFLSQVSKTFYKYVKEIQREVNCFFENPFFCNEYKNRLRTFVTQKLARCDFIPKTISDDLLLKINSEEGSGQEIVRRLNEADKSIVNHQQMRTEFNGIVFVLGSLGLIGLSFFCLLVYLIDALSRALF